MSDAKHTPGQWHWDSDEERSSSDPTWRRRRYRVVTTGKTITQIYREDEHAEADARLIAAAPTLLLLAECDELHDQYGGQGWKKLKELLAPHGWNGKDYSLWMREFRRAALAAARGEQP